MSADRTKELLLELFGLVYELNKTSGNNWFFNFSGHVKSVSVYYTKIVKPDCQCCGEEKEEDVYLSYLSRFETVSSIKRLIKQCRELLNQEENETNPQMPEMPKVSSG